MMNLKPDDISALMREASERFILPRYKSLKEHEIQSKTGPTDLVTLADIETEDFLIEALTKILPGSVVIGEEGVSNSPELLDALNLTDKPIWIVDPVDGTNNFVQGSERFGSMIALVYKGKTCMSWIYSILTDEMVVSEQGAGAFSDGLQLSIKASDMPFEEMTGFLGSRYFPKKQQAEIEEAREKFNNTENAGCAAYEYLQVAKGLKNFAIYRRLKPWDHVPGTLMVLEAGGFVRKWDGCDLEPLPDQTGILVADGQHAWELSYNNLLKDALKLPNSPFA